MNRLEDKLSNHIKTVFEEFEETGANHGWTELRKKFPARNNERPLYLWLSGIAASFLISGIILFYNNKIDKTSSHTTYHQNATVKPSEPKQDNFNNYKAKSIQGDKVKEINNYISSIGHSVVPVTSTDILINVDTFIRQDSAKIKIEVASGLKLDSSRKHLSINEFLENETRLLKRGEKLASTSSDKKPYNSPNKALFDVYTATFLNYYADNPVKLNAGAGVNANIRINKKLYFLTGAGISKNNISYQNRKPSSLGASAENISYQNGYSVSDESITVDASFVNIDIPLAVKFYPGKSGRYYLLTGINSSTYINQKLSRSFNAFNSSSSSYGFVKEEIKEDKLSGFDIASSAVFAIGINQKFGKANIIFEPFFKPYLKGLGENNIKINTVGLNLKLSLGTKK